ncbi:MAG TPA: hypothetical protein VMH86_01865 [Rhizomicrobium sp.]|nr:hypothetical protein [Rhizomicrobium sp.]
MPVADFAQNVQTPFFPMVRHQMDRLPGSTKVAANAAPATQAPAAATADNSDGGFWHDVLDVVNPLQHLPIVGTIYRSITGDKMGDVEKVAGDTLYGGPIGLVTSLADVAFEKITGKDFEDTLMGWAGLGHDDGKTDVAAAAMKPLPPRTTGPATITPVAVQSAAAPAAAPGKQTAASAAPADLTGQNAQALLSAMNQNGIGGDLSMRALFAYQKTMGLGQSGSDPAP